MEDRRFFGFNDGTPWRNVNSSGMLEANGHLNTYPCNAVNKTVPYFREFTPKEFTGKKNMFDYIGKQIKLLGTLEIDFYKARFLGKEVDDLPDGAFYLREANKKHLKYNL